MKFTKMHGTGNDYVYVNLFEETISDISDAAIRVSDRHFGIGSDGLIAIAPSDVADCRMIMYNAVFQKNRTLPENFRWSTYHPNPENLHIFPLHTAFRNFSPH